MQSYTLFELNQYIRRVIALNLEEALWIQCEIAQCNTSRGHTWIELVEKGEVESTEDIIAQASAVLWSRTLRKLRKEKGKILDELLQDGMDVRLKVKVDFNERYGMKLIIEDIDPSFTVGKLALQRRKIIEQLDEENLLDKNQALALPQVIQRIAVISSENAAGYQDFTRQLNDNPYGYQFQVTFFPSAMQGVKVEKELFAQLRKIHKRANQFDVVAILRGGGARLDLSAFDNYALGKETALMPIPVLVGIGHDIDETVLDLVAHQSLKTPTALADFIVHQNELFEAKINQLGLLIQSHTTHTIKEHSILLEKLVRNIEIGSQQLIQIQKTQLDYLLQQVQLYPQIPIQNARNQLDKFGLIIDLLKQESILERGYTLVYNEQKELVKDPSQVKHQETLALQFYRGQLKVNAIKKETDEE